MFSKAFFNTLMSKNSANTSYMSKTKTIHKINVLKV